MSKPTEAGLGTPGAIESNAGDEYHILWACRRALLLLDPNSGLDRLCIEEVSQWDETSVENPDSFLAVDISEYFGGDSIVAAEKVVISQLKYSQRHPEMPWTAARLAEKNRGAREKSVIARLAQAFSGYYDIDRTVVGKLTIKLVSNRPADSALIQAVLVSQDWLRNRESVQTAELLGVLSEKHRPTIERLKNATSLKSKDFCDFLRCLDFSDCNSEGRQWQRLRLMQEVGEVTPASPAEKLIGLYDRIATEARPKIRKGGLQREDVLAALGCHGYKSIFPAPQFFEKLLDPILTQDSNRIIEALRASPTRKLLAHGAGGVGKTSTVLSLPEYWNGNKWIFYDCFGGGTYKESPGDERHSDRRALLQLSNELALCCGTPFLISAPESKDDLWREFRNRLSVAADILSRHEESLILVIDAADNSVQAADTPEDSFVTKLWKIELPDNVFLLMTARSGGRARSLQAPEDTPKVELTGFSIDSTKAHLKKYYETATTEQVQEFHNCSHGNPRVQNYALNISTTNGIESAISQARLSLDKIFQDYIEGALTLNFAAGLAKDHLDDLSCFPRPLRLNNLEEVFGLPSDELHMLCDALSPGLSKESDGWRFKDEDFDTFLSQRLEKNGSKELANKRISQRMISLPDSHFSATHIAEHLFKAKEDKEVITLALSGDESVPGGIEEVSRVDILRRRVALGIKSATRTNDKESLVRLTVQAADIARSKSAISELIQDHLDLSVLYVAPEAIEESYLSRAHEANYGPVHLRCAALYSRYEYHHARAREHLKMAESWIRIHAKKCKEENNHWRFEYSDIAAGGEAVFRLDGPEKSFEWMGRWRPLDSVIQSSHILANAIAGEISLSDQIKLLKLLKPHPLVAIVFLVAISKVTSKINKELVEAVLLMIESYEKLDRHDFIYENNIYKDKKSSIQTAIGIDFAELLAVSGIDSKRITSLLDRVSPVKSSYLPSHEVEMDRFNEDLRLLALRSEIGGNNCSDDDLADLLLDVSQEGYEHEQRRKRFQSWVRPRYSLYRLRAEALLKVPDINEMRPRLGQALEANSDWMWSDSYDFYFRDALIPLTEAALSCTGDVKSFLNEISDEIPKRTKEGAPFYWLRLAEPLLKTPGYDREGMDLIDKADQYLSSNPISGKEHCGELLSAAAMVQPHEPTMAESLFQQAVVISKNLNDDLCDRLRYIANRAESLCDYLTTEETRGLSARMARLTEETLKYIAEEENYPWQEVLLAITRIQMSCGIALFTRWADLGHIGIRSSAESLALSALESGKMKPNYAFGLLRLTWSGQDVTRTMLSTLEYSLPEDPSKLNLFRGMLNRVVNWVIRDISRENRPDSAKRVLNWLIEKKYDHLPEASLLKSYVSFLEDNNAFESKRSSHIGWGSSEDKIDWDEFFGNDPIPERLGSLLLETQKLNGYVSRELFYDEARKRLALSQRIDYLEALLELPDLARDSQSCLKEWEFCLTEWRHSRLVKDWAEEGVKRLVLKHLPGILGYPYVVRDHLRRVLNLPFMRPDKWLDILAPALAEWSERLEAWQLYPLANVLAEGLNPEEQKKILLENIADGELAIEERQEHSLPDVPNLRAYDDNRNALATFAYTLLGNPDKRIRWSCMHALKEMDLQNEPELLNELVLQLDSEAVGGYLPSDGYFLWMSARVYLMTFFERFSNDHPLQMLPHIQILERHATSKDFPHAQIRELAKRSILSVENALPGTLSPTKLDTLTKVNRPISFQKRNNKHGAVGSRSKSSNERRFHFDPLDTLPYWYSSLGRVFDLYENDIALLAESWICDRWGIFGRNIPKYRTGIGDNEWSLASNGHGHIPTVDEGRTYLEYHAMQLVAGELVDSKPSIQEYDDSDYGTWSSWLSSYIPARQSLWLSELRSSVPLEPYLHGLSLPEDESDVVFEKREYLKCLGLNNDLANDRMIVASSISINEPGLDISQKVESALVSIDTGGALLRALHSTDDPSAYRLPPIGDGLEINEPGFNLHGWIGYRSGEREFDKDDLLLYGLDTYSPFLPKKILEKLNAVSDQEGVRYFDKSDPNFVVAEVESWSDLYDDRGGLSYSSGWRLLIDVNRLLSFLKSIQRCLILEIQINRKKEKYGRKRNLGYEPPEAEIYILYPDGRFTTVGQDYFLGPNNTQRIKSTSKC